MTLPHHLREAFFEPTTLVSFREAGQPAPEGVCVLVLDCSAKRDTDNRDITIRLICDPERGSTARAALVEEVGHLEVPHMAVAAHALTAAAHHYGVDHRVLVTHGAQEVLRWLGLGLGLASAPGAPQTSDALASVRSSSSEEFVIEEELRGVNERPAAGVKASNLGYHAASR